MWGEQTLIQCPCGRKFASNSLLTSQKDWDGVHCVSCLSKLSFEKELIKLKGATVTKIIDKGDTYILVFSNGQYLTAEDGEYGDNAFEFLENIEQGKEL